MTKHTRWSVAAAFLLVVTMLLVAGCGDNDDPMATYQVTVTNTTNNQPMSPPAYILHTPTYGMWSIGSRATAGLEWLAEGGDPGPLLTEAGGSSGVISTKAGDGLIVPGGQALSTLTTRRRNDLQLSLATMLVNTNDAITGVTGFALGALKVGESVRLTLVPIDAGTEENSESASTIPGPAGGGEGYNATREGTDFVRVHPGVVTADDGLATSTLDESHRFSSPVAQVLVERTR